MKCLLIFAVTIAVAAAGHLFDPSVDDHEVCLMCGDPVVRTYDGAYLMVLDPTKTLMTQWNVKRRDACKFQVRCVTMESYCGDGDSAPVWVDWCGIAVWTHANQKKFFRNWMFGQNLDVFGERGQGNGGIITGIHAVYPNTHTFPRAGEDPNDWHTDVLRPNCSTHPYELWIDEDEEKISFRSHKDCCGWAVDFWPRGRDTCINIYAENGNANIEEFKVSERRTDGICGNMDGDKTNDWRKCFSKDPVTLNDAASLAEIAESCRDGNHEGQFYKGGTKLDSTSTNAGYPPKCPAHT